jgi:predicted transcriptional regulator
MKQKPLTLDEVLAIANEIRSQYPDTPLLSENDVTKTIYAKATQTCESTALDELNKLIELGHVRVEMRRQKSGGGLVKSYCLVNQSSDKPDLVIAAMYKLIGEWRESDSGWLHENDLTVDRLVSMRGYTETTAHYYLNDLVDKGYFSKHYVRSRGRGGKICAYRVTDKALSGEKRDSAPMRRGSAKQ